MSFVAFGVLPADVLAQSQSAMADAAAEYLPPWGASIVALGAMSAFLTSINGSVLVPSRMFFVFSEDRLMPAFLSAVHPKWRTPHISLIISAVICSGLIWTQSAEFLLKTGLIGIFIIYFLQGIALMMLPKVNRPLYESALFKPSPLVVSLIGLSLLRRVWSQTELWTHLHAGAHSAAAGVSERRRQGSAEGFDYEARMARDMTLEA